MSEPSSSGAQKGTRRCGGALLARRKRRRSAEFALLFYTFSPSSWEKRNKTSQPNGDNLDQLSPLVVTQLRSLARLI